MTSTIINDASLALKENTKPSGVEMIPMGNIRVQKITSIADFKSKNIDFRSLRPAVMVNQTLIFKDQRNTQ
jgi:hypothetical protein